MDIQQLRYYETLATTRNFTRASAELHLTQSALSKSISALEAELNLQLLDRTKKRIDLTECGKEFLRFSSAMLQEYDACLRRMQQLGENSSMAVNLVVTIPEIFVMILEEFHKHHPDISVRLPVSTTVSAGELMQLGHLDFIVNANPIQDNLIEWVPQLRDEYLLMVPKAMPFENGQYVNLSDFREEPFIMPQSNSDSRAQAEMFCSCAGFTPNVAFEISENEMCRKLVQFGYGVAFVSSLTALNTIEIPAEAKMGFFGDIETKFLRIRDVDCYRTIGMGRLKGRPLKPAAQLLYDHYQHFFKERAEALKRAYPPRL